MSVENLSAREAALRWPALVGASLALGLPLAGSQLAQNLIWLTDTVILGWLGAQDLAASVLGSALYFVFFVFSTGISNAVMTRASSAIGRGDADAVRTVTHTGIWLVTGTGLLVMIPLWFSPSLLRLLGQQEDLAVLGGYYARIAMLGIVPALIVMTLRGFLSSVHHAGILLWVTLAGVIVNALLVYVLVFGKAGFPALGLAGAAIGSVLTNVFMAVLLAVYSARTKSLQVYALFRRIGMPKLSEAAPLLHLGLPIGLTVLAEVGMFNGAAILMGWQGVIPLAAHGIVLQIASLSFMIPYGMSQAATVFVGQSVGRRDDRGIARSAAVALAIALVLAVMTALIFLLLAEPLIHLFLDESLPEAADIVAYGAGLMAVAAAFQIFDFTQVTSVALLRGVSDARVPMLIAVSAYWGIGLPSAWVLSAHTALGGKGVWVGLALGLLFAASLLTWRFYHRRRFWLNG